ncbi:hypothetical protein HSX10_17330 [Winogradskyella undariae]|uniref:hypothetical protein n=1 Tax=Winogradskyella undariae TaxID=1285465 RepID=UPI00156ADADC|nr:hypothetical protein [Winogradskyella undariae]NRR93339.1 hypothetical protein [Winogradskyella undariae]
METIATIFGILSFLFIAIPVVGIVLLLRYVIKKSRSEQPTHVLIKEKKELILKARSKKKNLIKWQSDDVEKISNNLDFNFSKGFTRKFNGYIKTLDNERIISFRKIDRGAFNLTSRILAVTSDYEIYYDQLDNEILIEFNGSYIGKIVNNTNLIDDTNQNIGSFNRNNSTSDFYVVQLNNEKLAYVVKNSDRRTFVRNPFHDFHPESSIQKDTVWERDVKYSNLMKLYRKPNEKEYNWILAIVIYEAIYYGIDFTQ